MIIYINTYQYLYILCVQYQGKKVEVNLKKLKSVFIKILSAAR
jgi:hypothetical protein